MAIFVKFSQYGESRGCSLGPYPYVQLTFASLRVGPGGNTVAIYEDNAWVLHYPDGDGRLAEEPTRWSDVVIFAQ